MLYGAFLIVHRIQGCRYSATGFESRLLREISKCCIDSAKCAEFVMMM